MKIRGQRFVKQSIEVGPGDEFTDCEFVDCHIWMPWSRGYDCGGHFINCRITKSRVRSYV